jgi:hypothetical protein
MQYAASMLDILLYQFILLDESVVVIYSSIVVTNDSVVHF